VRVRRAVGHRLRDRRGVLSYAAIGDFATACDLLAMDPHRTVSTDGSYLTGLVHPDRIVFPADEHSSYTAAAVILAADAITGASPASDLFVPAHIRASQSVED
jgi:hypothetical protein